MRSEPWERVESTRPVVLCRRGGVGAEQEFGNANGPVPRWGRARFT